ncbi:hypothetical protein [Actinomadura kijaniata]|uniref:hypothetical protein n=1 Tax=Actinomadura kijaniata TaxID=46161 RepID=UPI00083399D5|nr:hypothetical protein [Actinomadura kijaniata]
MGTLPGLFAGMLALAVAPRAAVPLAVLVIGAVVVNDLVRDAVAGDVVEQAARNVFAALAVFALGWLNLLHRELWLARGRLAEADAAAERLRAARDRGEALARALSAIGLRGRLAARLLAEGRAGEAAARLDEITSLAERSLTGGEPDPDLVAEIEEARVALAAAGVRTAVDDVPNGLPEPVHRTLGWVVREGAAHVLRHRAASVCSVRILADGRTVRLRLVNDGVPDGGGPAGGLDVLAAHLRAADGRLVHGPGPDRTYLLEAFVPLP